MKRHPPLPEDWFERLLDGTLDDDECSAAELAIEQDSTLQAAVEAQRAIDAAIRGRFTPPDVIHTSGASRATAPNLVRRHLVLGGIAAGIALLASVAWLGWSGGTPRPPAPPPPDFAGTPPDRLFARLVHDGFVAVEPCPDASVFHGWVERHLNAQLALRFDAPEIEILGWAYEPRGVITRNTLVLMARAAGEPIVLLIDRAEEVARPLALPEDAPVAMRDRRLGPLVAHEVSAFGRPMLLDLLSEPEA